MDHTLDDFSFESLNIQDILKQIDPLQLLQKISDFRKRNARLPSNKEAGAGSHWTFQSAARTGLQAWH